MTRLDACAEPAMTRPPAEVRTATAAPRAASPPSRLLRSEFVLARLRETFIFPHCNAKQRNAMAAAAGQPKRTKLVVDRRCRRVVIPQRRGTIQDKAKPRPTPCPAVANAAFGHVRVVPVCPGIGASCAATVPLPASEPGPDSGATPVRTRPRSKSRPDVGGA